MILQLSEWKVPNLLYFVTNQHTHTDKIYFTICYYSPTYFGRFCDRQQCVIQEFKYYTKSAQNL